MKTMLTWLSIWLPVCLWGSLSSSVWAEPPRVLEQVAAQLTSADIIAGEFEQAQHVAVLSRPLLSRGRFVFQRGTGLLWQVLEPVESSLVFGADGEVRSDGAVAGARALGFVARLLNSVLGGDLAMLDDGFHIEGRVEAEGWQLRLTPRGGPLSRFVSGIQLQGAAAVEQVALYDNNGDHSVLDFKRVVFPAILPPHAKVLDALESE